MTDTYKMIKDLENKLKFTRDQVTRGLIVAEIEKIRMSAKTNTPVAELKKIIIPQVVKAEEVNKNNTEDKSVTVSYTVPDEHNRGIVYSAHVVSEEKSIVDNGKVFEEKESTVEDTNNNNNNNNSNNNNKKKRH